MFRTDRQSRLLILLSLFFGALAAPMTTSAQSLWGQRITVEIGAVPLMLGIGILFAALIIEWHAIIKLLTIEHQSLYSIEMKHPHLPKRREVLIVVLLSLALTVFLTQVALRGYEDPISGPINLPAASK